MTSSPPLWQAHAAPAYDSTMTTRCVVLLADIIANPKRRQAIFSDPRDLHHELFASFAPPGHGEYAGAYRGTVGTSLANGRTSSDSQMETGKQYEFCLPAEVPPRMDQLLQQARDLLGDASTDDFGKLIALTYTFCWLGKSTRSSTAMATSSAPSSRQWRPNSATRSLHASPFIRGPMTGC
jgi:hypothetical protein